MNYVYVNGELYHHGIKGQKWGIRRFQNEDGSLTSEGIKRYRNLHKYELKGGTYTKRGIQKYKKTVDELNEAKRKYDQDKSYSLIYKDAKYREKKAYKQLHQDYLADQGKTLYAKGKRITAMNNLRAVGRQAAILVSSRAGYDFASQFMDHKTAAIVAGSVAAGATAVNAVLATVGNYEAKRLRAYYGH